MSNTVLPTPNVVYFGMRCAFSVPPLLALQAAGVNVCAIVLPGDRSDPPVTSLRMPASPARRVPIAGATATIDEIASSASIPVVRVRRLRHPDVIAAIASFQPDVIAVACFPWRIPPEVRSLARLGAVNVHPSLLPRWRGPEPIFWTFKSGDEMAGVTVHLLDDGYDTGPILRQARFPIPPGIDGRVLERELAVIGGRLLVETIAELSQGPVSGTPQDDSLAINAPMPGDDDFELSTDCPATFIFNAIRGIVPLWGPLFLRIVATNQVVTVERALDVDPNGTQIEPIVATNGAITVRCNPGIVTVKPNNRTCAPH